MRFKFTFETQKVRIEAQLEFNVYSPIGRRKSLDTPQTIKLNETNKIISILENKNIFIVHGHDKIALFEICEILKDDFGYNPIVLSRMSNKGGETLLQKFERYAESCDSAIVLITPDDIAEAANFRARQNVILEYGYFLGKFHSSPSRKILLLKKGSIDIPSDINGVVYLEFKNEVKEIFKELQSHFKDWEKGLSN